MNAKALLDRPELRHRLAGALREAPVVVLLGARQAGKTTLGQLFLQRQKTFRQVHVFDLERSQDRAALSAPELVLGGLKGLVIIDEVQRLPDLFTVLRPLTDRPGIPARFLLLGSASPTLVRGISETLAGRALFLHVPGFTLWETATSQMTKLWLRGGFPRSYLAQSEAASLRWREAFISTFLERDMPQLGIRVPAEALRRFWVMLAHYHGQRWNASEMSRSLGITDKTARNYLDLLTGAFVTRVLTPWYANVAKRHVKAPKIFIRDSGLLHALLGIETLSDLRSHPKYGASWEGFSLEQTLATVGERNSFSWTTQGGAEVDLFLIRHGRNYAFEYKCEDAPRMTRSLHSAIADLRLQQAYIVYPGARRYKVHDRVEVLPLAELNSIAGELKASDE